MSLPRRRFVVAAIVIALVVVWVGFAGSLLVATDQVRRPRVVFALSGDVLGDRERRAIEVAVETDTERLVFFDDGGARGSSPAEIRRSAVEAGVPPEAIRFVVGVDSTEAEARLAAGLVERCGWDRVAVVTSPYHTRRAGWTFRRAIGDDAEVTVVASEDRFDEGGWWRSAAGRELVLGEWAKVLASGWYVVSPPEPLESEVPC
jgi:uncharacterized SAM-binding protein YcdF (DUF218 family)